MTGLVRKATLLTGCGVLLAGAALAAVPNRANSNFPGQPGAAGIYLIQHNAVNVPQEDVTGEFSVTVRDISNAPISGATVTVNFSGCTTDIRLCQTQTFTGVSVDCPTKVVSKTTSGLGVATFRITGGAANAGNSAGAGVGCAEIRANGVFLNNVTVAAFDQGGGLNGVTGGDLSLWLSDFFALPKPYYGRSDYNFGGVVDGGDLSIWLSDFFSNRSLTGCTTACP